MKMRKIAEATEISGILQQFDEIFPHLKEKIDNIETFSEKLAKYALVYVGEENESPCGILVFYANNIDARVAYISLIGLLSKYQGKSLGKEMLVFCESESQKRGMTSIKLEVDLDNVSAIRFYEKNGYKFCGKASNCSMYMMKMLSDSH